MNIDDYSLKMEVYRGPELIKSLNCPKFYFLDYIAKFLYKDSPYSIRVELLDGVIHDFNSETITSFRLP